MSRSALLWFLPLALGLAIAVSPPVRGDDDDDDDDAPESADQVLAREQDQVARKLRPILEDAHKAFQEKNYDGAMDVLDKALKALAPLTVQKRVKDEWEAHVRYDIACDLSLTGKSDDALKEFSHTLELGYADWDQIAKDTDFDSIRKQEAFTKALEKARTAQRENGAAEAKKALEEKPLFDLDLEWKTLEGKTIKLSDLKGKVVVVDLFATGVYPRHLTEIGGLTQLYDRYKKNGLEVVGVACEARSEQAAKEAVSAFAKDHKIAYPLALGDRKALKKKVPGLAGLPTTLYLDREGKVRLRKFGVSDTNTSLEWFEGALSTLLEAKGESGK